MKPNECSFVSPQSVTTEIRLDDYFYKCQWERVDGASDADTKTLQVNFTYGWVALLK